MVIFKSSYAQILILGFCLVALSSAVKSEGLKNLLRSVEQQAPQLKSAQAKAQASEAGIEIAKSQYWGKADLFGLANHYNNDRLVNPISFPSVLTQSLFDNDTYGYGASFILPLDIDGRIGAEVQAHQFLNQAEKQNVQQTRLLLFGQTVSLYRGLQQLKGVKDALNQQQNALESHYRTTQIAVKVGRIATVELLRIDAEIKSLEGTLAGLVGDEVRMRSSIAALLNQQGFTDSISDLDTLPRMISLQLDTSRSVAIRPDIQAAKNLVHATDKDLLGAQREWLPKLAFRAETLHNQGVSTAGENNWSVGVQLSWQFWDGGRRSANSDRAHANRVVADRRYQSAINQARAQLKTAHARWQATSGQYRAAVAGLQSAIKTEQIQSERFNEGRISAVDLIDAEAALARVRAAKITALANWWLADDQLCLASGQPPSAYDFKVQSNPSENFGE